MNFKLAQNETVIKSWDYATSSGRGENIHSNLTITNKRLISSQQGKSYIKRDEIPVNCIKSISGEYSSSGNIWGILKLILGITLSLTFILMILGVPMVISAIKTLKSGSFNLLITTKGSEGSSLSIGASNALSSLLKKRNNLKVKINKEVSQEIINVLGAIISTIQNQI